MTLLSFCPRCMALVSARPEDETPDPWCPLCRGAGMVKATPEQKRAYWAKVSRELPLPK